MRPSLGLYAYELTTTIQLLSFSKDVCKILRVYLHSIRNSILVIKYSINMMSIYISSETQLRHLLIILSVSEFLTTVFCFKWSCPCVFFCQKIRSRSLCDIHNFFEYDIWYIYITHIGMLLWWYGILLMILSINKLLKVYPADIQTEIISLWNRAKSVK